MRANDCRSLQKCLRNFWTALYQFLKQEHFSRLFWTLWRLKIPQCGDQETLKHKCCRPFGEIILCCDNNPSVQYLLALRRTSKQSGSQKRKKISTLPFNYHLLLIFSTFLETHSTRISFKAGPAYNSVACQNVLTGNALFGWRPHDV